MLRRHSRDGLGLVGVEMVENIAGAVAHLQQGHGGHINAPVGEGAVGAGHVQQRDVGAAQREREAVGAGVLVQAGDAHVAGGFQHIGDAHFAQHLDLVREAERTGAGDFARVARIRKIDLKGLASLVDGRMTELDRERQLEAEVRV